MIPYSKLRFVLHAPSKWYMVRDPETDHRFDYNHFYGEVVAFLDAPGFEADRNKLLETLNR
jgi:hypothetical protein